MKWITLILTAGILGVLSAGWWTGRVPLDTYLGFITPSLTVGGLATYKLHQASK